MKFGNFVLKYSFLQIFIAFTFFAYAQTTKENLHKHKMIEAINSGNFEEGDMIFVIGKGEDILKISAKTSKKK